MANLKWTGNDLPSVMSSQDLLLSFCCFTLSSPFLASDCSLSVCSNEVSSSPCVWMRFQVRTGVRVRMRVRTRVRFRTRMRVGTTRVRIRTGVRMRTGVRLGKGPELID